MYSQRNIAKFKDTLNSTNWQNVMLSSDPQEAYTFFYQQLVTHYNTCFPLKTMKRCYSNRKPWMSEELRELVKRKNMLMSKSRKHPYSMKLEYEYNECKRLAQRTMRIAEREYYDERFKTYKSDLVKSWKLIKQIINRKKCNKMPRYFIINDKNVEDKDEISKSLNKFYVNLGPSSVINPLSYLKDPVQNSIFLPVVSELEVIKILKSLKDSSPGWDGLSAHPIL